MPVRPTQPSVRWTIAHNFARWNTRAAVNEGPVRSTSDVNHAIDHIVNFAYVLDESRGPIEKADFEEWHHQQVVKLLREFGDRKLTYLWAAKMIAIYLKTTCYLSGFGRPGLTDAIHPPIDKSVVNGLRKHYKNTEITAKLKVFSTITGVRTQDQYQEIIQACDLASKRLGCTLFEVEQLFTTDP